MNAVTNVKINAKGRKNRKMVELLYKELSYKIQGAFFNVYKQLGNGFKESIYHKALIKELKNTNLDIETQKRIDIYYSNDCVILSCNISKR